MLKSAEPKGCVKWFIYFFGASIVKVKLHKVLPLLENFILGPKEQSPNFASNNSISIPPDIIRKPVVF